MKTGGLFTPPAWADQHPYAEVHDEPLCMDAGTAGTAGTAADAAGTVLGCNFEPTPRQFDIRLLALVGGSLEIQGTNARYLYRWEASTLDRDLLR